MADGDIKTGPGQAIENDTKNGWDHNRIRVTNRSRENTVVVMLSTYNGGKYLREQLASVAAQRGDMSVRLMIRDDGSTDNAVEIIEKFKTEVNDHSIIEFVETQYERNIGFIASFFTLLQDSDDDADWYAFCDQDDIWQPDKLQRAIDMLNDYENGSGNRSGKRDKTGNVALKAGNVSGSEVPLLYTSRLQLVNESLEPVSLSPLARKGPSFENAMVENIVTGATIVMNRAAKQLLKSGLQKDFQEICSQVLLHDWWCYLVVSAFGKVIYDKNPSILYRQHESNVIGQGTGFFARQKRRLQRFVKTGNVRGITKQVALFERVYHEKMKQMPEYKQKYVKRFLHKDTNFLHRASYSLHPDAIRQTAYDSLFMRFLILFHRL